MTFKQKIMAVAAFDEQREWLLLADAMKKFGHDAIKSYPAAKVGAFAERGRLTPLITRLVDEVEVCIGALKLRQHHDEDCLDATEKFKPSEMCECGASVVKQVLEAHQKRWEDLK